MNNNHEDGLAAKIFGWIALFVIIVIAILILGWIGRGLKDTAERRAVSDDYQERFRSYADGFDQDISKLPRKGSMPTNPRLLTLESWPEVDRLNEAIGKIKISPRHGIRSLYQERELWAAGEKPAPFEEPIVPIAQSPSELSLVVFVKREFIVSFEYNTGGKAYCQEWSVAIINCLDKSVVAEKVFMGGSPPPKVTRRRGDAIGNVIGPDPIGAGKWIAEALAVPAPKREEKPEPDKSKE